MWLVLLAGCGLSGRAWEACECDVAGHGARPDDGVCRCLALTGGEPDPDGAIELFVTPDGTGDGSRENPWGRIDWDVVDALLAAGPVAVRFGEGRYDDRIDVLRTVGGEHRLVLDGAADGRDRRASVPGVHTGFEDVSRDRVTIRGFDVTGSRDKGIYFRAGDDLVIEDNIVHGNRGSPSINVDYTSRSGLPSSSIVIRDNHVYDQVGECVYIGGAEGTGVPSHARVEVVGNLIHDCRGIGFDTKHDALNLKDGLGDVRVERNVLFNADWGLEIGSAGVYRHNLVFGTVREGIMLNDGFAAFSDVRIEDSAVLDAGRYGLRATPERGMDDVRIERLTVIGAHDAAVAIAGDASVSLVDVVLIGPTAFFGWGAPEVSVEGCAADGANEGPFDATCTAPPAAAVGDPAGPDGLFFTEDDPWLVTGGATLP